MQTLIISSVKNIFQWSYLEIGPRKSIFLGKDFIRSFFDSFTPKCFLHSANFSKDAKSKEVEIKNVGICKRYHFILLKPIKSVRKAKHAKVLSNYKTN